MKELLQYITAFRSEDYSFLFRGYFSKNLNDYWVFREKYEETENLKRGYSVFAIVKAGAMLRILAIRHCKSFCFLSNNDLATYGAAGSLRPKIDKINFEFTVTKLHREKINYAKNSPEDRTERCPKKLKMLGAGSLIFMVRNRNKQTQRQKSP